MRVFEGMGFNARLSLQLSFLDLAPRLTRSATLGAKTTSDLDLLGGSISGLSGRNSLKKQLEIEGLRVWAFGCRV